MLAGLSEEALGWLMIASLAATLFLWAAFMISVALFTLGRVDNPAWALAFGFAFPFAGAPCYWLAGECGRRGEGKG